MGALSIKIKMPTGESDGEGKEIRTEKTFVATEIKGRMIRKAVEFAKFQNADEMEINVDTLDEMVNFVVEVFGNKFTLDDVYDGINVENIVPEMIRCVQEVVKRFSSKVNNLPNGAPANR